MYFHTLCSQQKFCSTQSLCANTHTPPPSRLAQSCARAPRPTPLKVCGAPHPPRRFPPSPTTRLGLVRVPHSEMLVSFRATEICRLNPSRILPQRHASPEKKAASCSRAPGARSPAGRLGPATNTWSRRNVFTTKRKPCVPSLPSTHFRECVGHLFVLRQHSRKRKQN